MSMPLRGSDLAFHGAQRLCGSATERGLEIFAHHYIHSVLNAAHFNSGFIIKT